MLPGGMWWVMEINNLPRHGEGCKLSLQPLSSVIGCTTECAFAVANKKVNRPLDEVVVAFVTGGAAGIQAYTRQGKIGQIFIQSATICVVMVAQGGKQGVG